MCGGTGNRPWPDDNIQGLSPRVRGNQGLDHQALDVGGSIPACAGEPPAVPGGAAPRPVYPRVCGGTGLSWSPRATKGGLSPRVRGNLTTIRKQEALVRSIPACAGEPFCKGSGRSSRMVYPRVCGGTVLRRAGVQGGVGLSPRVRGNHPPPPWPVAGDRSIPACAGEPAWRQIRAVAAEVYPRVCGGTGLRAFGLAYWPGLSPRVRGNLVVSFLAGFVSGSIPACAGEPSIPAAARTCCTVYPRVCGGTCHFLAPLDTEPGLSPRVRGNPSCWRTVSHSCRSIPACAGEPGVSSVAVAGRWVYPRVCGGTPSPAVLPERGAGLSPRVRGNQSPAAGQRGRYGSIPACAGEPRRRCCRRYCRQVYPRVCGGTARYFIQTLDTPGLSPRVRGNPAGEELERQFTRSIPACAGEPQRRRASQLKYPVYPRVCGGTDNGVSTDSWGRGLSPRVRGNHYGPAEPQSGRRSIPACAGEPRRRDGRCGCRAVYPRVCGGTRHASAQRRPEQGLSPRVRGNRMATTVSPMAIGSIPACAGEPRPA